jgi:TonB family protein
MVTFAAYSNGRRLIVVLSQSMRPYFAVAITLFCLGVLTASPIISLAQEPSETTRKIVNRVAPAYPELAERMHISGTVKVEAVVAPSGKVKFTQVVGGSPVFSKSALDAVDKWKWAPAPQESKETIELHFHP